MEKGSFEYGKDDFLTRLQEIRDRTFKPHTIRSAWEKYGILPYNPAIIVDALQDILSSALDPNALNNH